MVTTATTTPETATMTPEEIDTILAANWTERARWAGYAMAIERRRGRLAERGREDSPDRFEQEETHRLKYVGEVKRLDAEAAPYQAEYQRRPWSRYYLVTSSIGHVHRGMYCSTCYPETTYAWLPTLSDCDEGKMIEEYGEMACTACFPNAPVHPAFIRSTEDREAAEAKKAAEQCPQSGEFVPSDQYRWGMRYAKCANGHHPAVTRTGKFRTHKS